MPLLPFHRFLGGKGHPLVVLHGLFGSSRNWMSVGKELSSFGSVYLLDARNHGNSPHAATHTLDDLRDDLEHWLKVHQVENPILLGHSMGGMSILHFALSRPEIPAGLLLVDIAPRSYLSSHQKEYSALCMNVSRAKDRLEIDRKMEKYINNTSVRQFLQTNLSLLDDKKGFHWKIHTPPLKDISCGKGFVFPIHKDHQGNRISFERPVLFIRGENSDYIQEQDHSLIHKLFSNAEIKTIEKAEHWLHHTHQKKFIALASRYIKESF